MTIAAEGGGAAGGAQALGLRLLRALNRPGLFAAIIGVAALAAFGTTYAVVSGLVPVPVSSATIVALLILDLALLLTLAALIAWGVVKLWASRRAGAAGARLHARFVAIFSFISVLPAIMVALFGAFSLNLGIESWFSERIQAAVELTSRMATNYLEDRANSIREDAIQMQRALTPQRLLALELNRPLFDDVLSAQLRYRPLAAAAAFDDRGDKLGEGSNRLLADMKLPDMPALERAQSGEIVVWREEAGEQIWALIRLDGVFARYLLITRLLDRQATENVRTAEATIDQYRRLEADRATVQLAFAAVYAALALAVLMGAILFALWAANRLVTPIGELIGAAERVSEGDLAARVTVERGDDEIATLGRVFNRMTAQLQSQRNELVEANRQFDARRRFTEAVLSGVTAGVIGLDGAGQVNIINRSALALLGLSRDTIVGRSLGSAVPEMAALIQSAVASPGSRLQGQVDLARDGNLRNLIVRVTSEMGENDRRGYVVTFDDITELVAAQRTAAWADVARRIAHEIKNPLTPIQLSAERLRRKYAREITTDPDVFEQCTQTIIRQVGDIGRMVDEFSSFARMPAPVMKHEDVGEIVRQVVFLQRVGHPHIAFVLDLPESPVFAECDGRLISQALINVLKNAAEAVNARHGVGDQATQAGRIEIAVRAEDGRAVVSIADNGIGLPQDDRSRLTEPYVTTRAKGTGLGLAIVKKVMEDHGGMLLLDDAPPRDSEGRERGGGALVMLVFGAVGAPEVVGASDDVEERTAQGV